MPERRDEEDEKSARGSDADAGADENDVEGHRRFARRAEGEGESAEKSEDVESDDVEGHMRKRT